MSLPTFGSLKLLPLRLIGKNRRVLNGDRPTSGEQSQRSRLRPKWDTGELLVGANRPSFKITDPGKSAAIP
ncbi:MAG TPA: hypothetical protein VLZ89_12975 [Anaerolineales bacterium]|nr:hypothetical protein [Anaerolineales bacterium]